MRELTETEFDDLVRVLWILGYTENEVVLHISVSFVDYCWTETRDMWYTSVGKLYLVGKR